MTSSIEEWRAVPGFERYEVSNLGNVRSLIKGTLVMRQMVHWKGYMTVYIRASKGSVDKKCFVHRLVALAFLPNPECHPIVNHKDLDKANNNLSNLEWTDDSGNQRHWRGMVAEKSEYDHVPF